VVFETVWTEEKKNEAVDRVCASVASGVSVTRTLALLDNMPAPVTFWGWMGEDDVIAKKVARAREAGVEALMEEARDIADQTQEGEIVTETPDGVTIKREDMLGHRKLRVETRFKYAQMIAPRKYGPKVDITSGGERMASADPGDVATKLAGLLAAAKGRKENGGG
jgi:hypothetical protein